MAFGCTTERDTLELAVPSNLKEQVAAEAEREQRKKNPLHGISNRQPVWRLRSATWMADDAKRPSRGPLTVADASSTTVAGSESRLVKIKAGLALEKLTGKTFSGVGDAALRSARQELRQASTREERIMIRSHLLH